MSDLQGTIREVWTAAEQRLDEAVRRASSLLPPTQEEIAALTRRLDAVAERLSRLEKERGTG